MDYAVSSSSGAPGSDDVSASCGAPDADGAKASFHDGQMDRSGHTGPHRGTKAGSHSGAEGVFYSGANGGFYDGTAAFSNDGTATFSDDGTATFSKDGAAACYSRDAKAFDIDDSSSATRGAKRESVDGYRDCSDASMGCIWTAAYANDGSTYAAGGPICADTHCDNGSKDVPSTKVIPSVKLGGATSKAPPVPVIAVDVPDPVAVVSSSSDDDL